MGLEDIISRIEADSEKEARAISDEAEEEAARIKGEAKKKAQHILSDAAALGEREREGERTRRIAQANVDARKTALETKQRIIDQVFRDLYEYLNGDGYTVTIEYLARDLPDEGVLLFPQRDKERIARAIGGRYRGSPSDAVKDGFVLKAGAVEHDCTFTTLLETIRERMEGRVVEVLFGEGDPDG